MYKSRFDLICIYFPSLIYLWNWNKELPMNEIITMKKLESFKDLSCKDSDKLLLKIIKIGHNLLEWLSTDVFIDDIQTLLLLVDAIAPTKVFAFLWCFNPFLFNCLINHKSFRKLLLFVLLLLRLIILLKMI